MSSNVQSDWIPAEKKDMNTKLKDQFHKVQKDASHVSHPVEPKGNVSSYQMLYGTIILYVVSCKQSLKFNQTSTLIHFLGNKESP